MDFDQSFCTSPWFHMQISAQGQYVPCRWMTRSVDTIKARKHGITNQSPIDYFQETMAPLRRSLLAGEAPVACQDCYSMEQYGKVSGRQKQLLKTGVRQIYWARSLASSPLRADLDYSNQHDGRTIRTVSDWQIDLGNYCNSACVYCSPFSSSTLAAEFVKLGLIDQLPPNSWCDDPVMFKSFLEDLSRCEKLHYLHFLGGETLITPAFPRILQAIIDTGQASAVTIGFTTNLTVWRQDLVDMLSHFQQVNVGVSIETMTRTNDYVRYPSKIDTIRHNLERWTAVCQSRGWLAQMRITPTLLTIQDIDTIYQYAWDHDLAVESCNFLTDPACLRISALPPAHRQTAISRLTIWLDQHAMPDTADQIINTRTPSDAKLQMYQDARSYRDYLIRAPDESHLLPQTVQFLKQLETNRKNSILDYAPWYEDLFRSAGY